MCWAIAGQLAAWSALAGALVVVGATLCAGLVWVVLSRSRKTAWAALRALVVGESIKIALAVIGLFQVLSTQRFAAGFVITGFILALLGHLAALWRRH